MKICFLIKFYAFLNIFFKKWFICNFIEMFYRTLFIYKWIWNYCSGNGMNSKSWFRTHHTCVYATPTCRRFSSRTERQRLQRHRILLPEKEKKKLLSYRIREASRNGWYHIIATSRGGGQHFSRRIQQPIDTVSRQFVPNQRCCRTISFTCSIRQQRRRCWILQPLPLPLQVFACLAVAIRLPLLCL